MSSYCVSRFATERRVSREVQVGSFGVGGSHPIRIQSMTTTLTQDVDATVKQSIALAEAVQQGIDPARIVLAIAWGDQWTNAFPSSAVYFWSTVHYGELLITHLKTFLN